MKLAFCILRYFPLGGLQKDFLNLLNSYITQDPYNHIDIYTLDWAGDIPDNIKHNKNITIIILKKRGMTNHTQALNFSEDFSRIVLNPENINYNLIIGFNKMANLDIYFAGDRIYAGSKSILSTLTRRYKIYTQLEKAVFGKNSHTKILVLTNQQRQEYHDYYKTDLSRFEIVEPNIDACFKNPDLNTERLNFRQKFNFLEQDIILLTVCSFFKTKGLDRSLRALASTKTAHLVIVGGDNPKPYTKLIKKLNIHSRVHFMGAQDNTLPFYAGADIFIHPARQEAAGKVLLEAKACHLPIITTANCGYARGEILPEPFDQEKCNGLLQQLLLRLFNITPKNFNTVLSITGELFREQPGRKTLKFTENNKHYFLKCHYGVGWIEIIKNLIQLKLPIISAKNEVGAIQRLARHHFTPRIVDYDWQGKNPATQQSFIITESVENTISLEDFKKMGLHKNIKLKQSLLRKIGHISKIMHDSGVNHRDFYLCHFLLDINTHILTVIDWHRAHIRDKVPLRWRVKDIAGLYFSAMDMGLTKTDLLRFRKIYSAPDLPKNFWEKVSKKAHKLYAKY